MDRTAHQIGTLAFTEHVYVEYLFFEIERMIFMVSFTYFGFALFLVLMYFLHNFVIAVVKQLRYKKHHHSNSSDGMCHLKECCCYGKCMYSMDLSGGDGDNEKS